MGFPYLSIGRFLLTPNMTFWLRSKNTPSLFFLIYMPSSISTFLKLYLCFTSICESASKLYIQYSSLAVWLLPLWLSGFSCGLYASTLFISVLAHRMPVIYEDISALHLSDTVKSVEKNNMRMVSSALRLSWFCNFSKSLRLCGTWSAPSVICDCEGPEVT